MGSLSMMDRNKEPRRCAYVTVRGSRSFERTEFRLMAQS